jgi:hypothetical protein
VSLRFWLGLTHGVGFRTIRLPTESLLTVRSRFFNRCVENLVEIGRPRQSKSPGMSGFELFAPNDSNLDGSAIWQRWFESGTCSAWRFPSARSPGCVALKPDPATDQNSSRHRKNACDPSGLGSGLPPRTYVTPQAYEPRNFRGERPSRTMSAPLESGSICRNSWGQPGRDIFSRNLSVGSDCPRCFSQCRKAFRSSPAHEPAFC